MAYVLSHMHSLIRGSVGGVTYLANQFHQIVMRARTAPVQPNTAFQVGIRTAFDAAEASWLALSEANRDDWRFYALSCVYPGPAGDYTVPGRQLFVGTLALAIYANAIEPQVLIVTDAPPVVAGWLNVGPIEVGIYTEQNVGITVVVQNPSGQPCCAVVDVSIAFNLTRTRYKGPWISGAKVVRIVPPGSSVIEIERPLGTLGKAIFTRTRCFSSEDFGEPALPHRLAFPVHLRHICAEPPINGNGNDETASTKKAKKVATKKKAKTGL